MGWLFGKNDATAAGAWDCARCGINMLSPEYTGKVYECPVCEKRYCEKCWNKLK